MDMVVGVKGVGYILLFVVMLMEPGVALRARRVRRGWLSGGGRPSDMACAFDPCSVSNFCGAGRTCELDDNCRHQCTCDPGSNHESCIDVVTPATTHKPSKCTFNLCDIPSACDGNRKCSLNELCRIQCECTSDSNHESCVAESDQTTTAESSTVAAVAVCDVECQHGVCVRSSDLSSCQCDKGWGGDSCHVMLDTCSLECGDGFRCDQSANLSLSCVPEVDMSTVTVDTVSSSIGQPAYNICSEEYKLTDKPYQSCSDDYSCQHGTCAVHEREVVCECVPGAAGVQCDTRCCLDCGQNGACSLSEDMVEVCSCSGNFTGENCSMAITQASPVTVTVSAGTWYLWVVGVGVVMLLVLLVLLVAVPYALWRHRVILVMKIIHYFQGYEDDDERQWDAFVSYKSTASDEKYVVHTLMPKLEKELGFRLHVHFRDFLPGDTIANNIIRAVLGSRRTILVVSPEYACAEWTKLEYQVAQQEMLKRKHRIIPIVLQDMSEVKDKLEPNLKAILEAVTYLEYPKCGTQKKVDKFWKRLELSLPKKRATSVEQGLEAGIDNTGYCTIRPDTVGVSDKTDRGLHSGYMESLRRHDPEEDYDTLNEAEMNERNIALSERDIALEETDITPNGKNSTLNEGNITLNETNIALGEKYDSDTNTGKYLDILNGDIRTLEV